MHEFVLLRLNTDYEIYQMELMMARLSLSIISDEKRREEIRLLRKKKDQIENEKKDIEDQIYQLAQHIDFLQSKIKSAQDDSKAVDNRFKAILEKEATAGIDQNKLKELLKNGPKTKNKRVAGNEDLETQLNLLNSLDPYTPAEKEKIKNSQPLPPNREIELEDIPEGVPAPIIDKLIASRKNKLEFEKQVPYLQKHIKEVEVHKKWTEKKFQKLKEKLEEVSNELKSKEQENVKQTYNTELLLKLKQALVEVPQQPVVTDYSDAILINRNVVEEKTILLRTLAGKK